jgi:hypothetical protein
MKQEIKSTKFERNGWYERLLDQHRRGKLHLTDLSIPTRLALAEYEKRKRQQQQDEETKAA